MRGGYPYEEIDTMSGGCSHKNGDIITRRGYKDRKFALFQCDDCGDIVLATADGLEQRSVVNSIPPKEIMAYMMPDPNIPDVL